MDLSEVLDRLNRRSIEWSEGEARAFADDVNRWAMAIIDWDDDAGEEWISLIAQKVRVCMISTRIPLVFVAEGMPWPGEHASHVEVIRVPSFDAPVLRCNLDSLRRVLETDQAFSMLDGDEFSANDLWFATI